MSIKRILAAAAASVVAVSAMSVIASAGTITSGIENFKDDGSGNYQIPMTKDSENVTGVDVTKIASFELTFSWSGEDWVGGKVITQCDAESWKEIGEWSSAPEDEGKKKFAPVESGKPFKVDVENAFAADSTYVIFTIQSYGAEVNLDAIKVYDASGAVLWEQGSASAPAESKPEESKPEESKPEESKTEDSKTESKPNVDTGVEGVAAVVGVAAVAAGALVVAKKRK